MVASKLRLGTVSPVVTIDTTAKRYSPVVAAFSSHCAVAFFWLMMRFCVGPATNETRLAADKGKIVRVFLAVFHPEYFADR